MTATGAEQAAQWTERDVEGATPAQVADAMRGGLLADYMAAPRALAIVDGQATARDPNHAGGDSLARFDADPRGAEAAKNAYFHRG